MRPDRQPDTDPRDGAAPEQSGADVDLGPVADSVDEDRAIVRSRSRTAHEASQALGARATAAHQDAERAIELAVSALAEADGLRRAMETRTDIDVAKGILVERHRVDPRRAFEMLVEVSQKKHIKLLAVAQAVIASAIATDG